MRRDMRSKVQVMSDKAKLRTGERTVQVHLRVRLRHCKRWDIIRAAVGDDQNRRYS